MTDPSESVDDEFEEHTGGEVDFEAPPGDVADQRREVGNEPGNTVLLRLDVPLEANPADAADQWLEVPDADDEYP